MENPEQSPGAKSDPDEPSARHPQSGAIADEFDDVERIAAVGDVHGDYPRYMQALSQAEVVDEQGNWCGGRTHLVQIGDIPDRGPDSAQIIRHMQQLEQQAEAAGGRVHALLGNHELMNLMGQLHYVHPGEYEALCNEQSTQRREAYCSEHVGTDWKQGARSLYSYARQGARRADREVPLGYAEHRDCWSLEGEFGSWVAGHNTVIRINNVLFVHAGISPRYLGWSIRAINERMREELRQSGEFDESIATSEDGPLWYRGLVLDDEAAPAAHVAAVLDTYDVDHVVVGHTPSYETIVPRYDGKVVVIDSGLSRFYGGAVTALVIEDRKLVNLQRGERITIPTDSEALLDYYRTVSRLEPYSVSLLDIISRLEAET